MGSVGNGQTSLAQEQQELRFASEDTKSSPHDRSVYNQGTTLHNTCWPWFCTRHGKGGGLGGSSKREDHTFVSRVHERRRRQGQNCTRARKDKVGKIPFGVVDLEQAQRQKQGQAIFQNSRKPFRRPASPRCTNRSHKCHMPRRDVSWTS